MTEVCIVGASRTPFGRFLGALSKQSAVDLAVHAGRAAIGRLPRDRIDQVIVGNVLSAGQGMNIARQIGVRLKLPIATPAFTVNMMCGSGLQAVLLAAQAIRSGAADVVLCGGTESMSNSPHILRRSRIGTKLGDSPLEDTLLCDGLVDTGTGEHMALTAERLAAKYAVTRQQQDVFALASQQRYSDAVSRGQFAAELTPLEELRTDEHPRPETTSDQLARLNPAFRADGTITAGNASGINDGAAMLVLCRRAIAEAQGWPLLAAIGAGAVVGCDPAEMGIGPVHAARKLLASTAMQTDDLDTIEINEAFAAQTLACMWELNLLPERVNRSGGAIAIGHPIGASGARLVVHLAHQLHASVYRTALATICIGGGMGAAVMMQRATDHA